MSDASNERGANAGCTGWRDAGDTTGDWVGRGLGGGADDIGSAGMDGPESGGIFGPSECSG
jgi:hypothetical protein